jgi:DnaJ-domain-containing protein 1
MTDYFALLDEPRRPWLEPDSLKARFLALSAEVHPDRLHNAPEAQKQAANQQYAELNSAYRCLREPKERLQHLLELELHSKPEAVRPIAEATMRLYTEVSQICRGVDQFLTERSQVTSPLLKVRQFELAQGWTDKLRRCRQEIIDRAEGLGAELRAMNKAWDSAPPADSAARRASLPLERLEELYRESSYLQRWLAQVQERIVRLSI